VSGVSLTTHQQGGRLNTSNDSRLIDEGCSIKLPVLLHAAAADDGDDDDDHVGMNAVRAI